jgi:hypothetical protein
MTASLSPEPDLQSQWKSALRLYPIYSELAREFVLDLQACEDLQTGLETPGKESVEEAVQWLDEMDRRIQVHHLRQFLQTSASINQDALLALLQHFVSSKNRTDSVRDKIDFLLVQYFSQVAPSQLNDDEVGLAYVAKSLEPALGEVELKAPVWLNALDRVLESARHCRSLDELLHGGVLEQGRKVKSQAGELFYLPVALVAFARFGYLMRRAFFHLMHSDLNAILDGVNELEQKGIATVDCRRAQFSAQEPVARLRMICQSWKVMFQAEYSSGQPLRMLVDLRASVEYVLGRGKASAAEASASAGTRAQNSRTPKSDKTGHSEKNGSAPDDVSSARERKAMAVAASMSGSATGGSVPKPEPNVKASSDAPEFEVSASPDWDSTSSGNQK